MGQMAEGVEAKYLVSLLPPSTQNFEADSFQKKTGRDHAEHGACRFDRAMSLPEKCSK
jgi:hypothetical protein